MWRSSLARVLIWFVALAGLGVFTEAQTSTGNVYGTVVDEQGSAVRGGTVTLTGPQAPRTTTVDESGRFRFLKVPPEKYTVTVVMPGFATAARENVIVTLGANTDVTMQLKLSNIQETVTVTSTTPLIDTRKVQTGITFSRAELQEIPTARDIYALMQQVPGIQLDTVNVAGNASGVAGGPDFSTKGAAGVTYQVDGATITDNSYSAFNGGQARQSGGTNTFFDFDTFQEVEIATGGSLLDLQQPGATINVVTKRGTNQMKGSGRFLYASDKWQSQNLSDEAIAQGLETNSTRFIREYGAEAGGPLWKDRLWLWAAGSRQDISLNEVGTDPQGNRITSGVRLVAWTAKLNAQIADPNALSLFYQRSDRLENGRGNSPSRLPETRTILSVPTDFYKVEDNHVFSSSLFASVFGSYQFPVYTDIPQGGLDQQAVYNYDPNIDDGNTAVWHNSYYFYKAKNPQYQGNGQVSKFFNTGKLNHELKASFNYRKQVNDSLTGWPGDQIFGYTSYAAIVRNVRPIYKQTYYSATLGDTLIAGNLTVNAGVRYDVQQGRNLASRADGNPAFPDLLPPVRYPADSEDVIEFKDWQPRVSAAYALGQNKTTLLRASYGRFADQLGFMTWRLNNLPITTGYYYYWSDSNGNNHVEPDEIDFDTGSLFFYNYDPNIPRPNRITPDFQTPLTDEFTVGADHQIFEDFAVSATYTYRHVKDLQYSLPRGAGPDTWALDGNARDSFTADNGFTIDFDVPFYFLTLDEAPPGDLFLNRPGATQSYHGIEFSAVKRLSNKWMLRGSVGWNSWKQHIPPEAVLDPNNRWGLGGENEDGGTVVGYSGKDTLWINARWQFNVSGLYQFPLGISAAANFFGREGYPLGYYLRGPFDINSVRVRNLIGKIDQYRLDDVYQLDLRFEKSFPIGPVELTALAEVFNVTNAGTVLQRETRVGNYRGGGEVTQYSLFNQIIETQSPRIWRLGARISF